MVQPKTDETKTILVTDDEPLVRNMISVLLKGQGYTVLEAGNGVEALQVASEQKEGGIDLLLTDVAMPQMDGIQLVREFRERFPDTRVILMSGYTDESNLQYAITGPSIAFLEKPFPIQRLEDAVQEVLGLPSR